MATTDEAMEHLKTGGTISDSDNHYYFKDGKLYMKDIATQVEAVCTLTKTNSDPTSHRMCFDKMSLTLV